ncbi:VanZ family protein [Brevibacterium renqingii]|uniref:VanZ family protein n=1 Tax=Brevibacterium renqingii TaxID=2776916 RepID=UPI001ADFF0C7|nr:VanZ family protein [Brevibacterium renqingii]
MREHDHRFGDAPLVLLIFYTIFIGLVTLTPRQLDTSPESFIGRLLAFLASHRLTQWLSYERVEMLANVGMFVPFGLLLALHLGRKRWWWGWVIGSAFSGVIEGVQGTVFTQTRFATLSDFVTNTIGAGLGAVLALLVMAAFPPREDAGSADRVVR